MIYPPLGAIASSIGGLAGARILSLSFLLGATILLYFTASSLFGRTVGIIATALWASTEAVFRLTFATYDPMSVLLIALAAWLAVEAGWRRRLGPLLISAATLALANATAYSSMVIDLVMLAFAYLVMRPRIGARRARYWTAGFGAAWAAIFSLLITLSGSWPGIAFTILSRHVSDYQPPTFTLGAIAEYTGFIIVAALTGAAAGLKAEHWRRPLLALLGASSLLVPAAQLYFRTAWALDKHLALDLWFTSMAAGYGCLAAARWVARRLRARRGIMATAGAIALLGLVATDWLLAWNKFHEWQNATSFVAAMRPLTARTSGIIFASAQTRVAEYYCQRGNKWWLWEQPEGLTLDPARIPRSHWKMFYARRLAAGRYDLIALFYAAPRSRPALRAGTQVGARGGAVYAELAQLKSQKVGEVGVQALTQALEADRAYRLVALGPYDSPRANGLYAIWRRAGAGGTR